MNSHLLYYDAAASNGFPVGDDEVEIANGAYTTRRWVDLSNSTQARVMYTHPPGTDTAGIVAVQYRDEAGQWQYLNSGLGGPSVNIDSDESSIGSPVEINHDARRLVLVRAVTRDGSGSFQPIHIDLQVK